MKQWTQYEPKKQTVKRQVFEWCLVVAWIFVVYGALKLWVAYGPK